MCLKEVFLIRFNVVDTISFSTSTVRLFDHQSNLLSCDSRLDVLQIQITVKLLSSESTPCLLTNISC